MWTIAVIGLVVAWIVVSYLVCALIERTRPTTKQTERIERHNLRRQAGYWTSPDNADSAN